jgi:hypothetical protein
MLFWAGVAAIVVLFGAVSLIVRALPRRGLTHILFEDLSAGRDERLDRNRALAQSIVGRLQNPQQLPTFDLQMDVMPGANEPGFGGLQPVLTMASVLEFERADRPVKIGTIEFSLGDLLRLITRSFVRPPERYLEGWLLEAKGSVEVGAQMLNHRRRPIPKRDPVRDSLSRDTPAPPLTWLVRGTSGRAPAIADLAAQILVDTQCSTLTSDWRSLRSFQEAMLLRDDQRFDANPESSPSVDPKSSAFAARSHLSRSVSYDPSNWIARFSLAVTLCRDNEPLLALQHLAILEKAVARAWPKSAVTVPASNDAAASSDTFESPGFAGLVAHLETLPECAFLVLFNKGIALAARKDNIECLRQARAVFEQLSNWMPPESGCGTHRVPAVTFAPPYDAIAREVKDPPRTTLALYAMGAHASLIADTDGDLPEARLEDNPVAVLRRLLERIDADCRVQDAAHWPSAMSARAITQAALAQVLFKRGSLRDAQTRYEESLAAEPRLVRALLGLAEIYLEHAESSLKLSEDLTSGWLSRADALLARATDINAGCEQGKRLRARCSTLHSFVTSESASAPA